jgi:ABC-type transporter Mla MlaB component
VDDRCLGPFRCGGALRMALTACPPGLAIGGDVDEATYPALVAKLEELARARDEVHADLSAVEFCDLAGLRAIVRLATARRMVTLHGLAAQLQPGGLRGDCWQPCCLCLSAAPARLADVMRARRTGRRCRRKCVARWSPGLATPYSTTAAKVILSMPGAPLFRRTATRAPQNVTAADLVIQRVEPPPGIGLGRPVQRMLQGTGRIPGNRRGSPRGGTSRNGTHRAPPPPHAHRRSSGPSHHRRLCCPPGSTGTTAASDAHPASSPFPGVTGL